MSKLFFHMRRLTDPEANQTRVILLAAGLEGLLCLAWLLSIPADSKNALLAGLSPLRLGMAAFLLLASLICLALASRAMAVLPISRLTGAALFALSLLGLVFVLLPPRLFGDYQYAQARLKPLAAWLALACLQLAGLVWWRVIAAFPAGWAALWSELRQSALTLAQLTTALPRILLIALAALGAGLVLQQPFQEVFARLPVLPVLALIFGILLILLGWFNHPFTARLGAWLALVVLLVGAAASVIRYPPLISSSHTAVRRINANSAAALGQEYHYSLSLYHLLSSLYPGAQVITAPGLLDEWGVSAERLAAWVPVRQVNTLPYDPILTEDEAQSVAHLHPLEIEINTLKGSVYYQIVPPTSGAPADLMLFERARQRFILPAAQAKELFPQRAGLP